MQNSRIIQIDLDKTLVTLFCCYALSMPFELILEIIFGIETIFKPFRIMSMIIIGVFGLKVLTQGIYLDKRDRADWFLYGVFIYGIIISCFKIITGVFNMGLFINDSFQFSLHVATFFIYKSTPISKDQAFKIFRWFLIGVTINAVYISYSFLIFNDARNAGFTDNPNYGAFGIVAASTYLILKTNFESNRLSNFWSLILILLLLYTFGVEGSRTGFVMFVIACFLIFFYSDLKRRITLVVVSTLIMLMLVPGQQSSNGKLTGPMVLIYRLNQSIDDGGEDVRFVVWRGVFKVLEREGYEGMGIGQFKANFKKYYSEEPHQLIVEMTQYGYYLSTHNDFFAIITDYGLPSLLFYFIFLTITFFKLMHRANYHRADKEEEFLSQFCFIFFCGMIIFGMSAENFQHQLYWFLLMFTTKRFI